MKKDILEQILEIIYELDNKVHSTTNITEQTLAYVCTINLIAGLAKGGILMEKTEKQNGQRS
jgi:predicted transcriptional regulator